MPLPFFFSWEFFVFIVFAILKPGVNMLSQGALADPVWGDVLREGNSLCFLLRFTRQ